MYAAAATVNVSSG